MSHKKQGLPNNTRIIINILCLLFLALVALFTPTLGRAPTVLNPAVKAAYTKRELVPVSQGVPAPSLTATGVYVIDLGSGSVLFEKNPHLRHRPASLTKIMTALVSLDHYSEDYVLSVVNGQRSIGASAHLRRGDKLTFEDALAALLIPSGNDAAVTLAENYPGGYMSFIAAMNDKAQVLGLSDTHFSNVSGLEGTDHYTTAHDIAMIAKSALNRRMFASIVSTPRKTIKSLKGVAYPLETTNTLLGTPGVLGVKTGWTPQAGECLVTLVNRDKHPILISMLNSNDRFGESKELIEWIYKNYIWE